MLAQSIVGCYPVPSVAGRPANVLPIDAHVRRVGGGAWYFEREYALDGEVEHGGLGYYHDSTIASLSTRCDVQGGANNTQLFSVLRYQVLGRPAEYVHGVSALSLEVGGSVMLVLPVHEGLIPFPGSDFHLGVNISVGVGEVTPYFSFRHHWGHREYWWDPDEDGPQAEQVLETWYQQQMFLVGVEVPLSSGRNASMAIEFFLGRPPDPEPTGLGIADKTWGMNIIFRR